MAALKAIETNSDSTGSLEDVARETTEKVSRTLLNVKSINIEELCQGVKAGITVTHGMNVRSQHVETGL